MTTGLYGWMRSKRSLVIGAALGLLIALTWNPAIAEEASETSPKGAGLQAASWLSTVPYGTVKVAYALVGGIVGGLTWALTGGNTEIAKAVWIPSMTGHYIVEPENLTGDKPLHFMGASPEKSPSELSASR
jgi:hypothetical protein